MITIDRNININEARAAGPYFVHHEGEAGGGFYDIALAPHIEDKSFASLLGETDELVKIFHSSIMTARKRNESDAMTD